VKIKCFYVLIKTGLRNALRMLYKEDVRLYEKFTTVVMPTQIRANIHCVTISILIREYLFQIIDKLISPDFIAHLQNVAHTLTQDVFNVILRIPILCVYYPLVESYGPG